MARPVALTAAIAVALLAVAGAGGAPEQTPTRGGALVFAAPQPEPACLNPLLEERCYPDTSTIPLGGILRRVLLEPFEVGPDLTWRPRLVSSWQISRRAPFTLTYRIHPEARWSDGVHVTARDFAFTYRMVMAHGPEWFRDLHAVVRQVTPVNAKTVRIVLRSRFSGWPGLFGNILPSHVLRAQDFERSWLDRVDDPRNARSIGSGPFLIGDWERGRQLTLVRNPRYWGRPAHVNRLVVQFGIDGGEIAERLERGQLHVAWAFPANFVSALRGRGLPTPNGPAAAWEHLELRLGVGGNPLLRTPTSAAKLIRRALAYGVDRVAIARQLTRDTGLHHTVRDSVLFTPGRRFYVPNWSAYRYRPEEARRLLEQAGCRRGSDAIYTCNGTRLSLRFSTHVARGSSRPSIVELMQAQLRQAGVEVVPSYFPSATVFGPDGLYAKGRFDAAMFAWSQTAPTTSATGEELLACKAPQNYTGYCQRLVTRELDQAGRILEAERQAEVLNRADRLIAADVPYLPLFQHPVWAGLASNVRGYTVHSHDLLLGAENWWLADKP